MPHGYLKHATKGEFSRRVMRGGSSAKSGASASRRRLKEIKLGGDGQKKGSRGHGGKGALQRELMHEVEWSRTDSGIYAHARTHRPTKLLESPVVPGDHVHFEAEPGVLVEGTIAEQVGGDFTVEVVGGIRIPGVRQDQLSLAPARSQEDSATTDSFVLVSAPLPRAESVGAPLPRTQTTNSPISQMQTSAAEEPLIVPGPPLAMTWANPTHNKDTPRPCPSFQALQAEDELRKSFEVVHSDPSPTACHTTAAQPGRSAQHPNPRVILGLQAMGFDGQLCTEAALCTGNESVGKAAQWIVEALEQHELARKASAPLSRPPQSGPGDSAGVEECVAESDSIGFVDKLNTAYTKVRQEAVAGDKEDEADTETGDEWELISEGVQQ